MKLRKEHRIIGLSSLLFLTLFVGLLSDFFFSDRLFYSRDMAFLEIPLRQHTAALLKEGHWALWTNAYGNGQPFLANPKNAVLYPSTWLYLILPFSLAFRIHFLFHGFVAWLGLFLLGRYFRWSNQASFLAATSFIFGGVFLSSFEFYNHVASLAWLPWIILVIHEDQVRPVYRTLWLAALWVLIILSGTPHVIPMTAIFGLLVILLAGNRRKERVLTFGISLLLAVSIAAVQLLPSLEMLKRSTRNPQETLRWSLEPFQLVNLIIPGFFGGDRGNDTSEYWGRHLFDYHYPLYYSLYASPGLLLLALLGLKRPRNRIQVFLAVSAAVFLLMSMAHLLPFFPLITKLPGAGIVRYPVKYLSGSILAISLLAAIGFDRLYREKTYGLRTTAVFVGTSIFALLIFIIGAGPILSILQRLFAITESSQLAMLKNSIIYALFVLILYSGLLFAISRARTRKDYLALLFSGLLLLDLAVWNRTVNPVVPKDYFSEPAFLEGKVKPLKVYRDETLPDNMIEKIGHDKRFQKYLRQSVFPYTLIGPVHYLYDQDFYQLYDKDYIKIVKKLRRSDLKTRRKILADNGAAFAISHMSLLRSGLSPHCIEGMPIYFEPVPDTRVFPYLTTSVVKAESIDEALGLFSKLDFEIHDSTTIVYEDVRVDEGNVACGGTPFEPLTVNTGLMTYSVKAPCRSLAVFAEHPAPGWRAFIDGKFVPILKANLTSFGIVVPEGAHTLTVRYSPSSFIWGGRVSVLTLLLIAAFLLIHTHKERGGTKHMPTD